MTPIIAEYFGIFDDHWDQRLRADTPLDKFNRLYVSFGKVFQQADGHLSIGIDGSEDRVKELIGRVKQVNPHAELFLTVGGDGGEQSFGGASKDQNFAPNAVQFLNSFGFTGLDLDWEVDIIKDELSQLTQNLQSEFQSKAFKLTLDGWNFSDNKTYDISILSKTLDQINIMSYGSAVDLSCCVDDYVLSGFPITKLIGGIETEIGYGDPDTLGPNGSIATKAQYALAKQMAGMMSWRMDNDYTDSASHPTYQGALQLWSSMKQS